MQRIIILFFTIFLFNCNTTDIPREKVFQNALDEAVNTSNVIWTAGVSMTIIQPNTDLNWTGVAGVYDKKGTNLLQANQPFRIASVTKTFVAVAILRLQEESQLFIDNSIEKYISTPHLELLQKGGYDPSKITIRHCLNHTSGLYDYALGENSPYLSIVNKKPRKKWTRTEQLEGAMTWGKPSKIGEKYAYGDTGYILLGEIIENITRQNLGLALCELIDYQGLGMNSTWLETIEKPLNDKKMVRRYLRRQDYTDWDASIDLYGGGGLISTTMDLSKFIYGLFNHKIFKSPATLDLMLSKTIFPKKHYPNKDFEDYRLGLIKMNIYGETAYYHHGIWDTYMIYIPSKKVAISVNFTDGAKEYLIKKVIKSL